MVLPINGMAPGLGQVALGPIKCRGPGGPRVGAPRHSIHPQLHLAMAWPGAAARLGAIPLIGNAIPLTGNAITLNGNAITLDGNAGVGWGGMNLLL